MGGGPSRFSYRVHPVRHYYVVSSHLPSTAGHATQTSLTGDIGRAKDISIVHIVTLASFCDTTRVVDRSRHHDRRTFAARPLPLWLVHSRRT